MGEKEKQQKVVEAKRGRGEKRGGERREERQGEESTRAGGRAMVFFFRPLLAREHKETASCEYCTMREFCIDLNQTTEWKKEGKEKEW